MKVKYHVEFQESPKWLRHVEIEKTPSDIIRFTAVKRGNIELGYFTIPLEKLECMIARMKED